MNSNTHWTCIGDHIELQRGNTYQSALLGMDGPVLLGLGSIARNGGFKGTNLKTYGGYSDPRMLLNPGDIYVSLKDVTQSADLLGAVARVPPSVPLGRLTQDTVKLIFRPDASSVNLIYWLLRTPEYRAYCKAHSTGTTNLGLAREDFFAFPVPPLTDALAIIIESLQALDDKIDLNCRMNDTLEAMARAIFKDWFVDFGPTRAKMEGGAPYLAPDIWALFPNRLDAEAKPEGWGFDPLLNVCELKRGYDLASQNRIAGPVPIISSSGPTGCHQTAMVRGPGIVTGRYGTIGEVFTCQSDFWPLNTTLYVRDFKGYPFWFVFHVLRGLDFTKYSDKAAVPGVNRNALHTELVVVPPLTLARTFNSSVEPLMTRIRANEAEAETLSATRDLLLPKLMSGEISVRDAENLVKEVA